MQPVSYSVPGDIRATVVRILAYMGGLAMLAIVAASFFQAPSGLIASAPAPAPEWVKVDRPHPAFELQMPELGAASDYAILRRTADGARKDILTWGDAADSAPFAAVEIYRPGRDSERFMAAQDELAARIVAFTVTDAVKPAGGIDSKFGSVPLVDFAITAHGRAHRCLGFARAFDTPLLQIAGWYCSGGEEVVDRATLACALDRLTMLSAGGNAELARLFAGAELKRTFCGQRNPILAATPERAVPVAIPRSVKLARSVALRGRLPRQ